MGQIVDDNGSEIAHLDTRVSSMTSSKELI